MFICIFSRTPLFVCGKPGSSKTITVNILKKMFNFQKTSGDLNYFDGFCRIKTEYYQGSEQSTDKGIDRVFRKAFNSREKYKRLPLVFIDNIGVAELNIHNPLKVLNKYLDSTDREHIEMDDFEMNDNSKIKTRRKNVNVFKLNKKKIEETDIQKQLKKWNLNLNNKVAFIGISNWNIDVSKMNRNIYLARPDLSITSMNQTGFIIIKQKFKNYDQKTNEFKQMIIRIILRLSVTYRNFREMQKVSTYKLENIF